MERPSETRDLSRPFAQHPARPEQIRSAPHLHPPVDVLNRADEILVQADMPGVSPDGIDVRLESGILFLFGKVRPSGPEEGREDLVREFVRADYYREFSVGEEIGRDKITAEYESGVLTVRLLKSEAPRSRRIEVKRKTDR